MTKKIQGYMSSDMKKLTDFTGVILSDIVKVVSSWKTPRSFISSHYYQVNIKVNGVWYTGRTAGGNMSVNLKVKKG